jgi:uncharacterized protein
MMRLENSFEVPAPPDAAWELLMDVPRVITCMPGAELTEVVSESGWKAKINIKLGLVALAFATDVQRESADAGARRVVLAAQGREVRGRGAAQATVESMLAATNGGTRVSIVTELSLVGAVAQFGRGMVQQVSLQLVAQFAECLRAQLTASPAEAQAAVAEASSPVRGFRLILAASWAAVVDFFRRLRRQRPS